MSATARPAQETDVPQLIELFTAAESEMRTQRGGAAFLASRREFAEVSDEILGALNDSETMVWCGTWDLAVVGYAIASVSEEDDQSIVTVRDIYTTPEAREVGVGEVLLEAAIAWAIASDAAAIDGYALPGARASKNLYERLGLTARLITVRRDLR